MGHVLTVATVGTGPTSLPMHCCTAKGGRLPQPGFDVCNAVQYRVWPGNSEVNAILPVHAEEPVHLASKFDFSAADSQHDDTA